MEPDQQELHELIQKRAKLAKASVEEMRKNPYTIEQARAQVKMLNEGVRKTHKERPSS